MNTLRTLGKYTAGIAAGAALADYSHEAYLYSRALKCMHDNQLAIEYSAFHDYITCDDHRFNHHFFVMKISPEKTEMVGAVCVQSRRHIDAGGAGYLLSNDRYSHLWKNDVNAEVLDNGLVDIAPIGHYLCHKISFGTHKQKLDRIANAAKKLPFIGESNQRSLETWKKTSTVVKRQ